MSRFIAKKTFLGSLKKTHFSEAAEVSISIFSHNNEEVMGTLIPVGLWALEKSEFIQEMVVWRKQHSLMFFSQFPVTFKGTYEYLKNIAIGANNRLLFFIFDEKLRFFGHIGIVIDESYVEIDNVVKGRDCEQKKTMYYAQCALLKWCKEKKVGENFFLHVLSYNTRAINLYRKLGFQMLTNCFLFKESTGNKITHKIVKSAGESNCPYTYQKMILPKKTEREYS